MTARKQGSEVSFSDVEPWGEPVDGAGMLDWIALKFERYLALSAGAVEALTLWLVHAHAHDVAEFSPILILKSPAMRCGKSSCLLLLSCLVPRPLATANTTGPVLFRGVEKYRPTLLMDEADSYVRENEDLRNALNSGHRRQGAVSLRCVGTDHEV